MVEERRLGVVEESCYERASVCYSAPRARGGDLCRQARPATRSQVGRSPARQPPLLSYKTSALELPQGLSFSPASLAHSPLFLPDETAASKLGAPSHYPSG